MAPKDPKKEGALVVFVVEVSKEKPPEREAAVVAAGAAAVVVAETAAAVVAEVVAALADVLPKPPEENPVELFIESEEFLAAEVEQCG